MSLNTLRHRPRDTVHELVQADQQVDDNNFDEVEALVMPEHTTVNATRKVRKWIPNALWVWRGACSLGYRRDQLRYENAVTVAILA